MYCKTYDTALLSILNLFFDQKHIYIMGKFKYPTYESITNKKSGDGEFTLIYTIYDYICKLKFIFFVSYFIIFVQIYFCVSTFIYKHSKLPFLPCICIPKGLPEMSHLKCVIHLR